MFDKILNTCITVNIIMEFKNPVIRINELPGFLKNLLNKQPTIPTTHRIRADGGFLSVPVGTLSPTAVVYTRPMVLTNLSPAVGDETFVIAPQADDQELAAVVAVCRKYLMKYEIILTEFYFQSLKNAESRIEDLERQIENMTLRNRPLITQDNIFSFLEESEGPMLEQEGCEGPMLEEEGCDKRIGRPRVYTPEERRRIKNRSSLKSSKKKRILVALQRKGIRKGQAEQWFRNPGEMPDKFSQQKRQIIEMNNM